MKKNMAYGLLTAFLLMLSFAPFQTGFLAYVALVPFFLLLQGMKRKEAFRWGYFTGFCIAAGTLYWIGWVTVAGLLGALLVWPLYIALYAVLHVHVLERGHPFKYLWLPCIWVAIEYLQSFTDLAFPWNYLGYTQSYYYPLLQYVEYTGIYGTSFWVVCLNILAWLMLREAGWTSMRWRFLFVALLLFIAPLLQGWQRLESSPQPTTEFSVALLQGNIDPFEKWADGQAEMNFANYERMTRQAAMERPDLIVWPETAVPFYLRSEKKYLKRVHHLADSLQMPILTGAIDYQFVDSSDYEYFNAALLAVPFSRDLQHYWKMQLVPFSERVPFRKFFLFNYVRKLLVDLNMPIGDYGRGREYSVMTIHPSSQPGVHPVRLAVPICFESAFPEIERRLVIAGAQMLVIITNDAWFGKTSGPHQHARMAVFRAIENRVPIARCANTGISCFIDSEGRTTGIVDWYRETILHGKMVLSDQKTFFTRHGNMFALVCAALAVMAAVAGLFHKPLDRLLPTL